MPDSAPQIRLLSQSMINRIAAGEVLERPASAVKELVENSIDAGADKIEIKIEAGGKNLISITDNGCGMGKDELPVAVQRHATSKLSDDDLFNIRFFGFRGEALPSIGSVAKLSITSRREGQEAWKIEINGGEVNEVEPASLPSKGTKIEVRDLFFATPARLKFLKSDDSERNQCLDVIRKIAMANPGVAFSVEVDGRQKLNFPKAWAKERITEIIGKDFTDNSVEVNVEKENAAISGFVGIPTYNRRTGEDQYVFVNGRPVKDKVLSGAIKAAYADFLGGGRFPVLSIFITVPAQEVDVNVHPAKSEVRFRDSRLVTGLVISALRTALESAGHRASTTVADFALRTLSRNSSGGSAATAYSASYYTPPQKSYSAYQSQGAFALKEAPPEFAPAPVAEPAPVIEENIDYPLGLAKCQLHGTYIVSEARASIILVDQHAAHERLVYERYKNQIEENNLRKQPLLVPEIVRLDEKRSGIILSLKEKLSQFGFEIEKFGVNEIVVSQVPSLLNGRNFSALFSDIADDVIEHGAELSLMEAFEHVLETAACHNSIRAGRRLSIDEMNQLLRQMEATPHSGQCNHGRPTYVELKLSDIEKLFGRS